MLRGTSLEAAWMQHEDVIRERLESVPLRAGEAIVFDNALVHCSYPNHSDAPRLAAAVGMVPTGAPLVYWRRSADGRAERREVDREFFLTRTPSALIRAAPEQPVLETVGTGEAALSATQLAALLDGGRGNALHRARRRLAQLLPGGATGRGRDLVGSR
jgi:ectoine hydroxylase-related dioxygenase (phytanoyl-CoA dioxygenase family)